MTNFDNNEDNVCLLLKDDVGGLRIRSRARSHNHGSCDHGVTVINFILLETINNSLIIANILIIIGASAKFNNNGFESDKNSSLSNNNSFSLIDKIFYLIKMVLYMKILYMIINLVQTQLF